ncbi:MAG: Ldh family oxidoreductase [Nitrospinota bacterium]
MVETGPLPEGTVRFPPEVVRSFLFACFRAAGVPEADARLAAEVLLSADLRGIRSHGLARVPYFLARLERGRINKSPRMKLTSSSDTTAILDADNAIGILASNRAMEEAMARAGRHGSGFVAVHNSSHFGYAGYWAKKAMEAGYIGISMSNGGARTTATFGLEPLFGTNPMSVAIPGGPGGTPFYLDMATAVVAVGKVETALREGRPVPRGWVPRAYGTPELDERSILKHGVPLLPLGGEDTEMGGHKGYGLSLMVELLCSVLSGSDLDARIAGAAGEGAPATGHFMGAIQISGFRDPGLVFGQMQKTFERIRGSKKAEGHDRIYIHGEPEAIAEEENRRIGVPVTPAILEQMKKLNERLRLGFEL